MDRKPNWHLRLAMADYVIRRKMADDQKVTLWYPREGKQERQTQEKMAR